jgi:RNA ligase
MFKLLTRDAFREGVFARDGQKCVVCGSTEKLDAHHILERRLWPDGGYYMANGATVCEEHHLEAEATTLGCDRLRELCGTTKFPLPPHLYSDQPYDKWGNPILPNGTRLRGELFDDPSVQKVMAPVLALFTNRVKYPRTYHLPWSPGTTDDDRVIDDLKGFEGERVIVTVKMDGENTTMYRDYLHARSLDYDHHPSRSWVRALHGRIAHEIPEGWRLCGENLYAKHSIKYEHLADYFLLFSIWNDKNVCLSWDETCEWAELLGLQMVPMLYMGLWDEESVRISNISHDGADPCEGYVVRVARELHYREFRRAVAKYVRKDHVQTHGHWMRTAFERNGLAQGSPPA